MTHGRHLFASTFGALVASLALASGAQAALGNYTTFFGADDGAVPGGSTPNASTAQASFLAAAAAMGPVRTNYLDDQPLGDLASYHVDGFQVDIPNHTPGGAGDWVGIHAGTYSDQNGPFSTIEGPNDAGKWMGLSVAGAVLTFDVPTYSFGFYATGLNESQGDGLYLYVDDTSPPTRFDVLSLPDTIEGGIAYYGVVFDHAIQKVEIFRRRNNAPIDTVGLDGFSFNTAAATPVPEPAGWALMLAGLGLLRRQAARRQRPVTHTRTTRTAPGTAATGLQEHA